MRKKEIVDPLDALPKTAYVSEGQIHRPVSGETHEFTIRRKKRDRKAQLAKASRKKNRKK